MGQGFLDVGDLPKPRNQLEALARATGDFRGTGEFLLPNKNLRKNGVVDFRRTGHGCSPLETHRLFAFRTYWELPIKTTALKRFAASRALVILRTSD